MRMTRPNASRGFTLTELLVVMAIIGILISFILIAAADGVRRAEEKATLSLITKLDVGISERIEALLLRRAEITQAHIDLSRIYHAAVPNGYIEADQRAQVIAQFDLFKAELPDVFFVQLPASNDPVVSRYPLNFAATKYQGNGSWGVPLGSVYGGAAPGTYGLTIGMFGATYQAAAGLYKQLGYLPQGYDGADNNGDGFIDDINEGAPGAQQAVFNKLASHNHATARSEMLYALLVEGVGPLGSTFSRDDFTQREVADTDGDGLLEFVDAWGQPLQFYRWPIFYNPETPTGVTASYVQKGGQVYSGPSEVRQLDPLDPNQMLVALPWWLKSVNTTPPLLSGYPVPLSYSSGASAFMVHFHSLLDPNFASSNLGSGQLWDRSGFTARRAFYSRFLVLSGGSDKTPGTAVLPTSVVNSGLQLTLAPGENNAGPSTNPEDAHDDITNQGLASPGGGVR